MCCFVTSNAPGEAQNNVFASEFLHGANVAEATGLIAPAFSGSFWPAPIIRLYVRHVSRFCGFEPSFKKSNKPYGRKLNCYSINSNLNPQPNGSIRLQAFPHKGKVSISTSPSGICAPFLAGLRHSNVVKTKHVCNFQTGCGKTEERKALICLVVQLSNE